VAGEEPETLQSAAAKDISRDIDLSDRELCRSLPLAGSVGGVSGGEEQMGASAPVFLIWWRGAQCLAESVEQCGRLGPKKRSSFAFCGETAESVGRLLAGIWILRVAGTNDQRNSLTWASSGERQCCGNASFGESPTGPIGMRL